MTWSHLLEVLAVSGGAAAAVGVLGAWLLRVVRHRPLRSAVSVVALVSALAVAAATGAGGVAMFYSSSELPVILITAAVAGLAGLGVALLLARSLAAGSSALGVAARSVGGETGYDAPAVRSAEFAGLAAELAATHDRLRSARERERMLEESRRELVAWVSHDLRTPLAGLRAMAEALQDRVVADPPTVSRYSAAILVEVDRLAGMVDDLFELSHIHAGALRLTLAQVPLADVVSEALASADPIAAAKGVRLHGRPATGIPVSVDVPQVGRVLRNLLTNAIRHTPADGSIEVVTSSEAGSAVVSVTDTCGGIPPAHLPRVFDVAFRGEAARSPAAGAGLGLAIARGIVEAHAGVIEVANVGAGCRFVVRLPLAAAG